MSFTGRAYILTRVRNIPSISHTLLACGANTGARFVSSLVAPPILRFVDTPAFSIESFRKYTTMEIRAAPTNYGVVLFPGFQALDVFGPLDVLNMLSKTTPLKLSIIAKTLDPVSTLLDTAPGVTMGQSVVPTHTFENPPADIDVLIVPGGKGTRHIEMTEPIVSFLQRVYPRIEYLFTVCTGSALAARAGLLDGLRATSNKRSFTWVTKQRTTVDWVLEARWVVSKNIWTSSGISAGIDMMYAFVSDKYGEDVAADIAIASEYVRNTEADNDPFAKYAG